MGVKWRRALELGPLRCVWSPQEQLWRGHPAPPSLCLLLQGEAMPGETVLGMEPAVPAGLPRLTRPAPPPPIEHFKNSLWGLFSRRSLRLAAAAPAGSRRAQCAWACRWFSSPARHEPPPRSLSSSPDSTSCGFRRACPAPRSAHARAHASKPWHRVDCGELF